MDYLKKKIFQGETQRVVDVEASLLLESMQHELDTLWANTHEAKSFTIFRTPHNISQSKKNLFEPSVISIGPLHLGQKHLQALEKQKRRFLQDFLSRGNQVSLGLCISEMKLLETRTRKCYSEMFDDLDSNAFVKMMLLDGCFVLMYFLRMFNDNFIVEVGWNSYFIQRDLLLLENQIPFYIVENLYEIGNLNQEVERTIFVKFIAFVYLDRMLTADYPKASINSKSSLNSIIPYPPTEIHHLVHLCYHYLVPSPEKPDVLPSKSMLYWFHLMVLRGRSPHSTSRSLPMALPNYTGNISSMVIPSATELRQKGLKFIPKSKPKHMLDISFEYGILKIPRLEITDDTKAFFANLLAFEHSRYGKEKKPFTRFVAFLDDLVNTPNDAIILQQCGIVENRLGSEEDLANFLNQVNECNIFMRNHYLAELYMEVNNYIGSSWNRHRAKFIRDYFSNPWTIISLIAAFILLVLTFVQSFFAVFAYFRAPSP